MCGIVGYIGKQQAAPVILEGLAKLEYRGYDSAGMAVFDGEKIQITKAVETEGIGRTDTCGSNYAWYSRYWTYKMGNSWCTK